MLGAPCPKQTSLLVVPEQIVRSRILRSNCLRANWSAVFSRQTLQGRFIIAYLSKLICRSNFLRADFADRFWQSRVFKALILFRADLSMPILPTRFLKADFAKLLLQDTFCRAYGLEQILQSRVAKALLLELFCRNNVARKVLPEELCQSSFVRAV